MSAIRKILIGVLATGALVAAVVSARTLIKTRGINPAEPVAGAASVPASPADTRIRRAEAIIQSAGEKPDGYNLLVSAYMQKARETGDLSFITRAEATLQRVFAIDAQNYDAVKLQSKLLLTNHQFKEALEVTKRALLVRQDDHDIYGAITDAHVELGNYPEAVAAAQQMVNLRPDTSAYSRIAYLRSLHGDIAGAIKAMNVAVKAADPGDREAMAWCRVQLGNELLNGGNRDAAEREYDKALLIFPGHNAALEAKARVRIAAGDLNGAFAIYGQQQAKGESADVAQALGDLYTLMGRVAEAQRSYEQFEVLERKNAELERSWRHMINYWLDHDKNLSEALAQARREREQRQDIFTCDLLAWALFKNGELAEATRAIEETLRLGTRDARISYHAGMIYNAAGKRQRAVKYLRQALVNPAFDVRLAETARQALAKLEQS
jgi:tetratricopeptide (TPR) repeat protein